MPFAAAAGVALMVTAPAGATTPQDTPAAGWQQLAMASRDRPAPPQDPGWRDRDPRRPGPPARDLEARVTPQSGHPGDEVLLEGRGFRPGDTVRLGVGPAEAEWQTIEDVRVGPDGRVSQRVMVPRWADPGDDLVFVLADQGGRDARTARFDIEGRDRSGRNERVDLRGKVTRGVECPILTTEDGRVYSLAAGGDMEVRTGVYAHVKGRVTDMSYCQQGTAVSVGLFEEVRQHGGGDGRHRDGRGPDGHDRGDRERWDRGREHGDRGERHGRHDRDHHRIDQDYVIGSWTARGSDCRRPDFAIRRNAAGGQVVKARLNGEMRTGYVRLGPDPAFIFDRPHREMSLDARRAHSLAVMPTERGRERLGDSTIAGDGVVFVRCAEGMVREPL
jgi:hypothetical protein